MEWENWWWRKDYTVAYTEDAINSMMDERMILKSDVECIIRLQRKWEAIFDEETKELWQGADLKCYSGWDL